MPDVPPPRPAAPPIDLDALFRRMSRQQTDWLAARVLRSIMLVVATVVGAGTAVTLLAGNHLQLAWPRLAMAVAMYALVGAASGLMRAGQARPAAWLMTGSLFLVLDGAGLMTRLGLGAVSMSGLALLITVIGAVFNFRAALLLSAGHLAMLCLAAYLHLHSSWMVPLGPRPVTDFLLAHVLLCGASLAGARVAASQVGALLVRALGEARRASELLRISADWTFLLDPRGRLQELSSGFETHTGLRSEDFLPGPRRVPARLRQDAGGQALRQALAQQRPFRDLRITFELPEGRWLAIQGNGEPLHDEHGRFLGWWGAARHVGPQVEVELALAEAHRKAEAANEAKSAFLATMSHEVRTPINGVLGLTRLLRQLPPDQVARREELLELLEGAGQELAALVNDVLDLSRMEAGKLSLRHTRIDLHRLVESCFRAPALLGRERGLAMHLQIDAGVPRRVDADPVRLRQLLANLLGNALKFTDRGEVALRLRCSAAGRVRFEVSDTGVGVPAEMRSRLFQPFEQADSSRTRRHGGSGLGLSICAQLAALMGGTIALQSASGPGSCFVVELPLQASAPDLSAATSGPVGTRLAGLRLLLVEDNPVNMLVAGALLRDLGAEVLEAHDGAQALALAARDADRLHLVLMDLHMPGMDGFDTTAALRQAPDTAHLPVLALSASVVPSERERAREAGMADFLVKPIESEELLRALAPYVPQAVQSA